MTFNSQRFVTIFFKFLFVIVAVPVFILFSISTIVVIWPKAIPMVINEDAWQKLPTIGSLGGGLLTVIAGFLAYIAVTMQIKEARNAEELRSYIENKDDIYELKEFLKIKKRGISIFIEICTGEISRNQVITVGAVNNSFYSIPFKEEPSKILIYKKADVFRNNIRNKIIVTLNFISTMSIRIDNLNNESQGKPNSEVPDKQIDEILRLAADFINSIDETIKLIEDRRKSLE